MNNLKQLGLALHNFHDAHSHFPPGAGFYPSLSANMVRGSILMNLLPFIEQDAVFKASLVTTSGSYPTPYYECNQVHALVVKTFINPSDPTTPGSGLDSYNYAVSGYVANFQAFPRGPNFSKMATISDGTSNTIALTEKYARCGIRQDYHDADWSTEWMYG